jgi:hypothetical protein
MAYHMTRQRILSTSYWCRELDRHSECAATHALIGSTNVCHCPCHPKCMEPNCQTATAPLIDVPLYMRGVMAR